MNNEKMKIWLHTQNPPRFLGFAVVVVICFVEIPDDFHDFVSECVLPRRKSTAHFGGVSVFPLKSDNFYWT